MARWKGFVGPWLRSSEESARMTKGESYGTHFRRHRPVAGPGFTHFVPSIPPLVQTSETSTSFSAHMTDPSGLERTRNADAMSPGSPFGPCGPGAPGGPCAPCGPAGPTSPAGPGGPCGPGLDSPHAPSAASVRMATPVQIVRMPQSPMLHAADGTKCIGGRARSTGFAAKLN
jgi:hypothetical protein